MQKGGKANPLNSYIYAPRQETLPCPRTRASHPFPSLAPAWCAQEPHGGTPSLHSGRRQRAPWETKHKQHTPSRDPFCITTPKAEPTRPRSVKSRRRPHHGFSHRELVHPTRSPKFSGRCIEIQHLASSGLMPCRWVFGYPSPLPMPVAWLYQLLLMHQSLRVDGVSETCAVARGAVATHACPPSVKSVQCDDDEVRCSAAILKCNFADSELIVPCSGIQAP